jgi:hypothetical protein
VFKPVLPKKKKKKEEAPEQVVHREELGAELFKLCHDNWGLLKTH